MSLWRITWAGCWSAAAGRVVRRRWPRPPNRRGRRWRDEPRSAHFSRCVLRAGDILVRPGVRAAVAIGQRAADQRAECGGALSADAARHGAARLGRLPLARLRLLPQPTDRTDRPRL